MTITSICALIIFLWRKLRERRGCLLIFHIKKPKFLVLCSAFCVHFSHPNLSSFRIYKYCEINTHTYICVCVYTHLYTLGIPKTACLTYVNSFRRWIHESKEVVFRLEINLIIYLELRGRAIYLGKRH